MAGANSLAIVARYTRTAFALAVFMEFSFVVALFATAGAFNGGLPTTTPLAAQVYFVIALFGTAAVAVRTFQMHKVARRGDRAALARMHIRAWFWIALLFGGTLPSIPLNAAAIALDAE